MMDLLPREWVRDELSMIHIYVRNATLSVVGPAMDYLLYRPMGIRVPLLNVVL